MQPLPLASAIWAASAVGMTLAWAFSMRVRNVGYVDVFWAGLMAAAALASGIFTEGSTLVRTLTALAGAIWGGRLCLYLLMRVMHEPEDGRYQALRSAWQDRRWRFFVFFQAQAAVVALFAFCFIGAASNPQQQVSGWTIAAIAIWILSLAGESLADLQLAAHRDDPGNAGITCRTGLWAWSRHPNYFFEWLHWFTYVLLGVGSPLWWLTWLGPVVMFAFLYRVSGIPWTEKQALRSRGEDYRRYQAEVSAFFPLPPRPSTDR